MASARVAAPIALALLTLAPAGARAGEPAELDPQLPYQARKLDPVAYDVDFRAIVTAPYGTKLLRVWVPISPSDSAQTVENDRFETFPTAVAPSIGAEPLYGNQFAYFEFKNPQGAQIITHRFKVTTHELRFDVDPSRVGAVTNWPESFKPYLRSESQAVVLSDPIRATAAQIVPAPHHDFGDLKSVFAWIDANMKYDHGNASLRASSQWALNQRSGHCSDYHGLCSALTRALGYPARVTYGINTLPKNSPSHCKAEVFLPDYGWVSFDVSETQKLCAAIAAAPALDQPQKDKLIAAARKRFHSGYRDNTWFLQTRGTDYDLVPPASGPVAVVRTIYAEADGMPLPDPDPGDKKKHEFAWMTSQSFTPDHAVRYPFSDWSTLEKEAGSP
jgi:transglutaminase-like putative cysteine protease